MGDNLRYGKTQEQCTQERIERIAILEEKLKESEERCERLEKEKQPRLTVKLLSFPESNGRRNWTALLVRTEKWDGLIGNCGGISIARGELWNRVAYEAECAKLLIGERDTAPDILDYGDDIETPEQWAGEVRGGRDLQQALSTDANKGEI